MKLGNRVTIVVGRPRWPPIWWGDFGATGWTPILWRLEILGIHVCWFYKGQPERFLEQR